jgi:FixJ family two-component response regulator
MPTIPLISIIDDDDSVRDSMVDFVQSCGFRAQSFPSAESFLGSNHVNDSSCLILDVRMPGMSGLALQRRMAAGNGRTPIIFVTSFRDDAARSQALGAGAVDFLYKPCREEDLLKAIDVALKRA